MIRITNAQISYGCPGEKSLSVTGTSTDYIWLGDYLESEFEGIGFCLTVKSICADSEKFTFEANVIGLMSLFPFDIRRLVGLELVK